MWVLDELRDFGKLFLKNVRRLLHLLSTTARKVCANGLDLQKMFYSLLFSDTPARVHKAMIDFNRWLAKVLDDSRAKGIEWGLSYRETPWLALEEEQPQGEPLEELFASDNTSTVELLRTACECYMTRCDRVEQTNVGLEAQVEDLKTQLQDALSCAFDSRQALDREKELSALHSRRIVVGLQLSDHHSQHRANDGTPMALPEQIRSAFDMFDAVSSGVRGSTEEAVAGDQTLVRDLEPIASEVEGEDSPESGRDADDARVVETERENPVSEEGSLATLASENEEAPLLELSLPSKVRLDTPDAESLASSIVVVHSITDPAGFDYQQLTQLKAREDQGGSWYRQALRSLKKGHKQHRRLRRTKDVPALSVHEFEQLVATRDPAEDGDDSKWYRRALEHLKHQRKTRLSLRNRVESFSSTVSIVD